MPFTEKATYKQKSVKDLDFTNKSEVFSSKIDGAHTVVQMEKGKLPRLFSHRISKRTGEPIEYTQKLPHIQNKSPLTGIFRAETFAVDRQGKAVHPDVVTALLNSGLENSLALQKKFGITTQTALIDVDSIDGKDYRSAPYKEKMRWMNLAARRTPDFIRPDIAATPEKKQALVTKIWAGVHPQTKEGIVIHDLDAPGKPFTKVKKIDHHDVVVRNIFHEEATKPGRAPMAGGFEYSWTPDGPIMGRVGTGFNHAMKKDMMANPDKYIGRTARVKALDLSKNRVLVKPSWDSWHVEKNISLEKTAFLYVDPSRYKSELDLLRKAKIPQSGLDSYRKMFFQSTVSKQLPGKISEKDVIIARMRHIGKKDPDTRRFIGRVHGADKGYLGESFAKGFNKETGHILESAVKQYEKQASCSPFQLGFEKRSALRPEAQLQPHQQRVKERIGAGQSLLLYHGLGSGKTLSSIAATEQPGKKVDVVVPASLRPNYKKELQKFTHGKEGPERRIQSYEGATRKGLSGGDVLVADEIQRINNAAATRSQAVVGAAPSYKQRILLTGTPIKNAPSELAPIIRTLNPEAKIPLDPAKFNESFLEEREVSPGLWNRLVHGAKPGIEVQPKNLGVLKKAIHGHIDYHAPEKTGYPSTSEQVVKVPMSEDQARVYSTVTNKANPFVAWKVRHNMPLSKQESKGLNSFMTAARVVSNTTTPYGGEGHSPKFERASEDMVKHFSKNPRAKALVYSNYLEGGVKEYSKYLTQKGIPHHIFTGEINDKKRKQMVEDYNNDKVKALLISGAGSEGLDLKGTRLVQVLEPHWNKQRIDQAVGRAVRFKSHAHLPPEEQHVHVMHYHSTHAPSFVDKIFHTKPGTSADEFLHSLSQKKEKINQAFLNVLQSEGERASKEWKEKHVDAMG